MPSEPAITVVVPAYNRAARIMPALQSVLEQDFDDFELVVVDDGSCDGTVGVVEAISDPRVRCLRQEVNSGVSAARNRGIHEARAPLIAFLDSDDQFLPHKLESFQSGDVEKDAQRACRAVAVHVADRDDAQVEHLAFRAVRLHLHAAALDAFQRVEERAVDRGIAGQLSQALRVDLRQ